jgi:hypothetical protein
MHSASLRPLTSPAPLGLCSTHTHKGDSNSYDTDKARSLTEQIEASVNQLATETDEARQSELFQTWLNAMAQFFQLFVEQSAAHRLPTPRRVLRSSRRLPYAWRKLGRHVKKGAKGIAILAPCVYRKKADDTKEDSPTVKRLSGFKTATFFVNQTPKGNLYQPSPTAPNPAAKNYSAASNGSPKKISTSSSTTKKSKNRRRRLFRRRPHRHPHQPLAHGQSGGRNRA